LYKKELAQKPQVIAVNKIDISEVRDRLEEIKGLFRLHGKEAYFISGCTGQGVPELLTFIVTLLKEVVENEAESEKPLVVFRPKPVDRRS
jgi:GTP-binding protein